MGTEDQTTGATTRQTYVRPKPDIAQGTYGLQTSRTVLTGTAGEGAGEATSPRSEPRPPSPHRHTLLFTSNGDYLPAGGYLVEFWDDGHVTIAHREAIWDTWGVPVEGRDIS